MTAYKPTVDFQKTVTSLSLVSDHYCMSNLLSIGCREACVLTATKNMYVVSLQKTINNENNRNVVFKTYQVTFRTKSKEEIYIAL